jgi:hypothetical protein
MDAATVMRLKVLLTFLVISVLLLLSGYVVRPDVRFSVQYTLNPIWDAAGHYEGTGSVRLTHRAAVKLP